MSVTFITECRRCLARRAVRVLIGIALLGCVATGVIGLLVGGELDLESPEPALIRLADLWTGEDAVLGVPFILLALGALIGGAVVVGGEWKNGTVPTVLAWQPRRTRLLAARLAACSALAVLIAFALLVVFVAVGVLPGVLVHGEVGDVGGDWAAGVAGAVARNLVIVALAAALGGAIASAGRSTTVAIVGVFAYQAVAEPIARSVWPERSGWLLSENAIALAIGEPLKSEEFTRSVLAGGLTVALYVGLAIAVALVLFDRRDVAA